MTDDLSPTRLDGSEGLTTKEARDLRKHEETIRKAQERYDGKVGPALKDIHDRRLYRGGHSSFESYCVDVLNMSVRSGYRHIAVAAEVAAMAELSAPDEETAGESVPPRHTLPPAPPSQRDAEERQRDRKSGKDPGPLPTESDKITAALAQAAEKAAAAPPAPVVVIPLPVTKDTLVKLARVMCQQTADIWGHSLSPNTLRRIVELATGGLDLLSEHGPERKRAAAPKAARSKSGSTDLMADLEASLATAKATAQAKAASPAAPSGFKQAGDLTRREVTPVPKASGKKR